MTTGTATDHRTVVDTRHRRPAAGAVTTLAAVAGLDMLGRFTDGCAAVMTARTIATDVGVIEHGSCPIIGVVAVFAGSAAGDVVA